MNAMSAKVVDKAKNVSMNSKSRSIVIWLVCVMGNLTTMSASASSNSTFTVSGMARFGEGVLISTFPETPTGEEYALRLSSGLLSTSGPVRFPDGGLQYTSARTGTRSTSTIIPNQTFSNTSYADCLTGSTVTLSMLWDGYVRISFSGGVVSVSTGTFIGLAVLQDGNSLSGYQGSGMIETAWRGNCVRNSGFVITSPEKISEGQHSFCVQAKVTEGIGELQGDSSARAHFEVVEIK